MTPARALVAARIDAAQFMHQRMGKAEHRLRRILALIADFAQRLVHRADQFVAATAVMLLAMNLARTLDRINRRQIHTATHGRHEVG